MSSTAPVQLWRALETLHYAYPALVLFYFLLTLTVTVCSSRTQSLRIQDEHVRRELMITFVCAVAGTYFIEAVTIVIRSYVDNVEVREHHMVYLLSSLVIFGAQALALTDSKFPVWYPYYGTWIIGLIAELSFLIVPTIFDPPKTYLHYILLVEKAARVCIFIGLPALYFGVRNDDKSYDNFDAERQSLLRTKLGLKTPGSEASTLNGTGYGTTSDSNSNGSDTASNADSEDSWLAQERKAKEAISKRLKQDGNWFTYAKGFTIFLPYLWPIHSKTLQLRAILVGCCLLASNALNLLIPIWMGKMVKNLTDFASGDRTVDIWTPVFMFAILGFIGGGACIGWLQQWLWMPIENYSYNALNTASHAHIMSLSSDFHDSKTTSDLTQAINGGQSVFLLVETVLKQVVPTFIDLAVAFCWFWIAFGPYMGLLMATFVVTYLYVTTKLYALRLEKRRGYITILRKEWNIAQQSLDGWNTAVLFNMIPYEQQRYSGAVKSHMESRNEYMISYQFIAAAQSFIMVVGKVAALCLGVWKVYRNENTIGDFTTLIVYWGQLQSPLTFFSTMYRSISNSLMDAERLLELFQTKPTITDSPSAKPLKLSRGLVRFEDVSFAYDERKPTLKNVSFTVPPGKTVALVGETGGGKSTILKLIDRFYDIKGGSISIDGQDIRDVTISSLRERIGVVPQDPTLFNDSIMNNIRYARLSASDEEVYEACKAAAVHEKILSFPDGYDSKVGDRGVKLSGGEKQRIAIARAILKRPEIILLDEATSAVDTETEQIIQKGLNNLCEGRTTFIVAHRLSTIMKADTILVVMNGEIVEEGSHDSLVKSGGKYHDLWTKQIFVKPSDKNRKKKDKDVINDVTDAKSTMDLAQALGKTTEGGNDTKDTTTKSPENIEQEEQPFTQELDPAENRGAQSTTTEGKSKGEEASKSSSGFEIFESRATAPDAVSTQVEIPSRSSSTKVNPKDATRAQKKLEKDEQKRLDKGRKTMRWSRKFGKKALVATVAEPARGQFRRVSRPCSSPVTATGSGGVASTDGAHSSEVWEASEVTQVVVDGLILASTKSAEAGALPIDGRVESDASIIAASAGARLAQGVTSRPKRRRYGRRKDSRSEPAGKAPDFAFGFLDGAEDRQGAEHGEGKVQGAGEGVVSFQHKQMRRVSAPSDPRPSLGQPRRRKQGYGDDYSKRSRDWRLKNQTRGSEPVGGRGSGSSDGVSKASSFFGRGVSSGDLGAVGVEASVSTPVELN